jgi:glycosyltransferase involved in cell wall biosynthesis
VRIVHVSDCYLPRIGGIERQVHDLAIRQQQRGQVVEIVTSTNRPPTAVPDDILTRRPESGMASDVAKIRYRWFRRGRDVVMASGFDVVHVHASMFSPLAFLAAASSARLRYPTVVTLHSMWADYTPLFRGSKAACRWDRWPVAWSAVSSIAAEPLQRILGPGTPVTVLPNGADIPSPAQPVACSDPTRVVIATVGRLSARKRPLALLRMLLEAVIGGAGPEFQLLQRFVDRHDMNGWVRLSGPIDHEKIGDFYANADFYVAPARLESFGIAALEARSAGLPVVAFAASGIADFISHDIEGLLARSDEEMIAHIVRLATSRSTLDRIRRYNMHTPPAITWPGVLELTDATYARAERITAEASPGAFSPSRTL